MHTTATPDQLAELGRTAAGRTAPATIEAVIVAVTHRQAHALPAVAARLLAVESDLATLRRTVAMHAARADAGEDPTTADLLTALDRAGVSIRRDVTEAAATLTAMHTAETRW